jgi:hypothetical protein
LESGRRRPEQCHNDRAKYKQQNEANSRSLTASANYAAGIRDDNVKKKTKSKTKQIKNKANQKQSKSKTKQIKNKANQKQVARGSAPSDLC